MTWTGYGKRTNPSLALIEKHLETILLFILRKA